jgi:hypothetical protein
MPRKKVPHDMSTSDDTQLLAELDYQFDAAKQEQDKVRDDPFCSWEVKEKMLLGRPDDAASAMTRSKVYDPRAATLVIEGANRIMHNLPTGKTQALNDKSDAGKNILMNMVMEKYVQKNANYGWDWKTKLRLVDLMSRVYGSQHTLTDYRVDDDYIGPDIYLLAPRSCFPQAGALSLNMCQYFFVEAYKTRKWLESRPKDSWNQKSIQIILDKMKDKSAASADKLSYSEREFQNAQHTERGKYSKFRMLNRYEGDRWITYCPDYNVILRDIKNPHDNDVLPIDKKDYITLPDRYWGLGQFERLKTLQFAHNSLINLYLSGVTKGLFGSTIIDPSGVVPATLPNLHTPAGYVYVTPNRMDAVKEMPANNVGLATFQSTDQFILSAISNVGGTPGDTSIARATDPTQGKTPRALELQAQRQSFGDSMDLEAMEQFIENVYNKMIDILTKKQEKPIEIELFKDDIEKIAEFAPDVMEVYDSGTFGVAKISKKAIGNTKYRYTVDAGSTMKRDEEMENKNTAGLLGLYLSNPNIKAELQAEGKDLLVSELFKRIMRTGGIKDVDKVLVDLPMASPEGMEQPQMGQMDQQMEMEMQGQGMPMQQPQMQGGQMPPQGGDPEIESIRQSIMGLANGR